MTRKLRSALSALSVMAVLAAAAVVWHNLPTPTDVYGPFDTDAVVGEAAQGRAVNATVTSIRIAPQVNSVQAAGQWVVVDTTLEAIGSTGLPHSELLVGDYTYNPTERFFGKTLGSEISPGLAQQGAWVFDVASELVAPGAAQNFTLRVWVGTAFLDSRLAIRIPADDAAVTRVDDIALEPAAVTAQ